MLVIFGGGFNTVNAPFNVDDPPPGGGVTTVTLRVPTLADWAITICAVKDVLFPPTDDTAMPSPNETVVEPSTKPVPFNRTVVACPFAALAGVIAVNTGIGLRTSKPRGNVTAPFGVVTETLLDPIAAPSAIEISTLSCVAEMNVTELTVTPVPPKATLLDLPEKLVPVSNKTSLSPDPPN